MKYTIRPARAEDMADVLRLIQELAVFEKEPDAVEVTLAQLREDGFGSSPRFGCLVGCENDIIAGMALFYPRYSTWKGLVIHLEDLIVTETARGTGLGSALLTEVIRYAAGQGARRVSWEVLDWNTPAIEFYEGRGARIMDEWKVVHLDKKGIAAYLENYARI